MVLAAGRVDGTVVQQISFRCAALQDVRDYYKKLVEYGAKINRSVSHGNAIGLYFQDPDGNQVEVYYPTNNDWPQPFGVAVDLVNESDDEIFNSHLTKEYVPLPGSLR